MKRLLVVNSLAHHTMHACMQRRHIVATVLYYEASTYSKISYYLSPILLLL